MKHRRLTFGLTILLLALAFYIPKPITHAQTETKDCDLTASICRTIARNLYSLCIAQGIDASQCAWNEANYTLDCMRNNGCQPVIE